MSRCLAIALLLLAWMPAHAAAPVDGDPPASLAAGVDGDAAGVTFAYRGYLQASSTHDWINDGSVLNPGNLYGLAPQHSAMTADLNLNVRTGAFDAVAEGYGAVESQDDRGDADLFQGYVSWTGPGHDYYVRAGRAVLGWGTGQIWNPVRAITNEARSDLIFPGQAIKGIDLVEARAALRDGATLTLLALAPDDNHAPWGYALRYAGNAGDLDYAFSYFSDLHGAVRLGGEMSLPLGPATLVGEVVRASSGTPAAGSTVADAPSPDAATLSYVVGANVVLPRDALLIAEYYHDGAGLDAMHARRFRHDLPVDAARYSAFGNGRDNGYLGISKRLSWHDSSVALGVFANRESEAGLVHASFETQLGELLRLQLSYIDYVEYAGSTGVGYYDRSVDARVRYNF